jgi:bacterioferritin-associated ferredoxin
MSCVVCVCAAVTESELLDAIRRGAARASALMACTGAGTTCGDCRDDLEELIEEAGVTSAGIPTSGIAGGEGGTMTTHTATTRADEAGHSDAGSREDEISREEITGTEIDWDDIDKASQQAHALLRELAASAALRELIAEACQELDRRLVETDGADRVVLLSPADRDWILEILIGDDAPPPDPAAPAAEYSVLSIRGGFEFTIFHPGSAGELVPSVTRFEQPGSCYTSRATLVQVLGTTRDTVALVLRRRTTRPDSVPAKAAPERIASVLSNLSATEAPR